MTESDKLQLAQHQLQEAINSQNAVFSAIPDLMFELDINGRYINVWANNPQELAASKKELLGHTIQEKLPNDAAQEGMRAIAEAKDRGSSFGRQIYLDTPSGKLWFELSVSVKNNTNLADTFIVISHNINDRKLIEEEKEKLSRDIEERMKELKCIYSVMNVARSSNKIDYILKQCIEIIPEGWHYPEFTQVRILLDDKEYFQGNFEKTPWMQSSEIAIQGNIRGRLEVYYLKEFKNLDEGPFLNQERDLIDNISEVLAEAIEREERIIQLKHAATHDTLTGVLNRQMLDKKLEEDFKRASRYQRAFSVLMVDIDYFKEVNDTFGHQSGDLVLKETVNSLGQSIRSSDYVGRYGGEEFIVALTETDQEEALKFAERMRLLVEKQTVIDGSGQNINITISIGIGTLTEKTKSMHDLVNVADTALYQAKDSGRNKVICL